LQENIHTFAIGDIHGQAILLGPLLKKIERRAESEGYDYRIVFLGNLIDRGPGSMSVLSQVANHIERNPRSLLLRGNHDWFLLWILDELTGAEQERYFKHWLLAMGGGATAWGLGHYGGNPTIDDIRENLPSKELALLRNAKSYLETDHCIYVHAGIKPGVPMTEQDAFDLVWIRDPFLSSGGKLGKRVVHGHTPTSSHFPEIYKDRIDIDTGAFRSNRLTALHTTPDGKNSFFCSDFSGVNGVEPHFPENIAIHEVLRRLLHDTVSALGFPISDEFRKYIFNQMDDLETATFIRYHGSCTSESELMRKLGMGMDFYAEALKYAPAA